MVHGEGQGKTEAGTSGGSRVRTKGDKGDRTIAICDDTEAKAEFGIGKLQGESKGLGIGQIRAGVGTQRNARGWDHGVD